MSGYTRINMMAIDPSPAAEEYGIDARFGRSHLDSDHLGVSYFRYPPDFRTTMGHRHSEQEEVYVVVSGSGRIRVDDDIVDVGPWDVVRVAPVRSAASRPAPRAWRCSPWGAIVRPAATASRWTTGGTIRKYWFASQFVVKLYASRVICNTFRFSAVECDPL